MSRTAYVNGAYVPHRRAGVHIEDRGYQFADGVYEVWSVRHGALMDNEGHFRRLWHSLKELQIVAPMPEVSLAHILREIVRKNRVRNGLVYLQVTRGVAPRDHAFPADIAPALVITAKSMSTQKSEETAKKGVAVFSTPDERWARCDIKSVSLLPNILAKQVAKRQGGYEAWMVDAQGMVTEGSSSNAWIVTKDGVLATRSLADNILSGVTRGRVLALAAQRQLTVEERPFSIEEAQAAKEAFLTAATNFVMPIVRIDDVPVGEGMPGPLAEALRKDYLQSAVT